MGIFKSLFRQKNKSISEKMADTGIQLKLSSNGLKIDDPGKKEMQSACPYCQERLENIAQRKSKYPSLFRFS